MHRKSVQKARRNSPKLDAMIVLVVLVSALIVAVAFPPIRVARDSAQLVDTFMMLFPLNWNLPFWLFLPCIVHPTASAGTGL
jgi:hypothetical protein